MIKHNGEDYLKIGEVSKILNRSAQTIKIWYEYAEEKSVDLPPYRTDLDGRGTRFWNKKDISKLEEFQESIKRGMFSDLNIKRWGKRGKTVKNPYRLKRFKEEDN